MCGIIGYIGDKNAAPILIEGLKKLEYRGYDSCGIALQLFAYYIADLKKIDVDKPRNLAKSVTVE